MRAFTQLSFIEGPERTQQVLNDFLGMLAANVMAQRGVVNKFMGDGVLAFFRGPDHATRAVKAGAAMVEAFPALRQKWDEASVTSLDFVDIAVGVATDQVILGSVGGDRVRDFTVIGTAVIRAAHLADAARNGRRLLVDKSTFRAARPIVDQFSGPEGVELRKPSQSAGPPYDRYEVRQLKGGAPLGAVEKEPAAGTRTAARGQSVFISYSHRDRAWLEMLQVHLAPYVRGGHVNEWSDKRIAPGARWQDEIQGHLADARVAVLLVSPHFLGSEFIAANELPPLLAAARAKGLTILWVPISASSYDITEIGAFQAAHDPARPLDTLTEAERNNVLVTVCRQIRTAAGSL